MAARRAQRSHGKVGDCEQSKDEQNEGLEVSCVFIYWWKGLRCCSEHGNRECINKLIPIDKIRQDKIFVCVLRFWYFQCVGEEEGPSLCPASAFLISPCGLIHILQLFETMMKQIGF